jgi:cellulose synthase/poly-beta-1,6-N-acetylglucosamine synthase-like glycosyltransferase
MHLCKFDPWLPGGRERRIEICPTANMACERTALEAAGGFADDTMLGDTLLSWRWAGLGVPIWFAPQAAVAHHHIGGWNDLLRERFLRGSEFAWFRAGHHGWSRGRTLAHILVTLLPLRLAGLTMRGVANARSARLLGEFARVSPVVVSGQAAWLAGEVAGYVRALTRRV